MNEQKELGRVAELMLSFTVCGGYSDEIPIRLRGHFDCDITNVLVKYLDNPDSFLEQFFVNNPDIDALLLGAFIEKFVDEDSSTPKSMTEYEDYADAIDIIHFIQERLYKDPAVDEILQKLDFATSEFPRRIQYGNSSCYPGFDAIEQMIIEAQNIPYFRFVEGLFLEYLDGDLDDLYLRMHLAYYDGISAEDMSDDLEGPEICDYIQLEFGDKEDIVENVLECYEIPDFIKNYIDYEKLWSDLEHDGYSEITVHRLNDNFTVYYRSF